MTKEAKQMDNARELEANNTTRDGTQAFPLGGRLNRRTTLIALTVAGVASGLFLGWDWLVAAGLAPLLFAVLPCAAMCALGLCATRLGQKNACAGSGETSAPKAPDGPVATLTAHPSGPPSAGRSAGPGDRA